jgi:hypothetical protein
MSGGPGSGYQQSIAFDENGQPFIILKEQARQKRLKGLEAYRVNNTMKQLIQQIK